VIDRLNSIEEEKLFISVITIGEIQRGIERLPDSHRKTELQIWMNNVLLTRFAERMITIDAPTMFLWGSLFTRLAASGQKIGVMDSLILTSALQNNLIVATRNVANFLPSGVQVINPWE
jgi:predicted nucleic acid-binding protein